MSDFQELLDGLRAKIDTLIKEKDNEKAAAEAKILELDKRIGDLKRSHGFEKAAHEKRNNTLENQIALLVIERNELEQHVQEASEIMGELDAKLKKLLSEPLGFGWVLKILDEKRAVIVDSYGIPYQVFITEDVNLDRLKPGQEVLLSGNNHIISVTDHIYKGEIATIKQILDKERYTVVVETKMNDNKIVVCNHDIIESVKINDLVRYDPHLGIVFEKISKIKELSELELEEVPNVTFENIGGLKEQIQKITEQMIWPIVYPEEFAIHKRPMPKGMILVGPPGCGKTMVAKAIAHHTTELVKKNLGVKDIRGYFLYVKGPELSRWYVGQSECLIRQLFNKAIEKSKEGAVVIIFMDEIESFLKARGSGISSDANEGYVTQFNSCMDGLQDISGRVVVIGATNRPDLIDPAVLREGRLELKLEVPRPNRDGTIEIFSKYLTKDLPFHTKYGGMDIEEFILDIIEKAVDFIFSGSEETEFKRIVYENGEETLYFKDFISGSLIKAIADRVKDKSIKRKISGGERGILESDLIEATTEKFLENKHMGDTIHSLAQEFVLRAGRRIVNIINLVEQRLQAESRSNLDGDDGVSV